MMKVQYHEINNSSYQDVWDFQFLLHNELKNQKRSLLLSAKDTSNLLNHVVLCEHRPVITLGKSASEQNLLLSRSELESVNTELFFINRGGDITFHGPGQCTGYLILDVEAIYRDVHRFVRDIEETIIKLLNNFGLNAFRIDDYTGVWLGEKNEYRKICAIGVHLSRWVSMHGFALNINTDLSHFDSIIPCGISDDTKKVTSLAKELGENIDTRIVNKQLRSLLAETFNFEYLN